MAEAGDKNHSQPNDEDANGPDEKKSDQPDESPGLTGFPFGLGGLFVGLGDLVERLGKLAEAGGSEDVGEELRGVYGLNVRAGIGDGGRPEVKVEPFGTVNGGSGDDPGAGDFRQPLTDIHEEKDHILLVVEIPGTNTEDVRITLAGNQLILSAVRGETKYYKKIVLSEEFAEDKMAWECKDGILRIRLLR